MVKYRVFVSIFKGFSFAKTVSDLRVQILQMSVEVTVTSLKLVNMISSLFYTNVLFLYPLKPVVF